MKTLFKIIIGSIVVLYIMIVILGGTFKINSNQIYLNVSDKTIININY